MPAISFHSFEEGTTTNDADARDLDALVEGVAFARTIAKNMSSSLGSSETLPGTEVADGDELRAYARARAWGHHASCSCPMGGDDDRMAVLDSRFRVRGTRNLRVVDASAFPKIPGFFIVAAIYMLSEKASDVLLDEASCKVIVDPTNQCNLVSPNAAGVSGGA
jgi:choline dehydrogenase-like flavoprotein